MALESTVILGLAACVILMSAGVIFNPQTVEDVKSIGQTFQNHLTEWGEANNKKAEVDECIESIVILNPFGAPDDGGWNSPTEQQLIIAGGLLNAFTTFVANVALGLEKIQSADQEAVGFSVGGDAAIEFWKNYPLFETFNTLPEGFLLCSKSSNSVYPYGGFFLDYSSFSFPVLRSACITSIAPYTSADYPMCTFVDIYDFSFISNGYICLSYEDAVAHWTEEKVETYYLTEDSFFSCPTGGFANKNHYFYFYKLGYIASDGIVGTRTLEFNTYYSTGSSSTQLLKPRFVSSELDSIVVGDVVSDLESGDLLEEDIPLQDMNLSILFPGNQSAIDSLQNVVQQFYGGDMTLEKYLELTKTADYGAAAPSIVIDIPMGNSITYYQNAVPSAINVLATSPDGGTISYEWYRYGTDANGKVYPVEVLDTDSSFLPLTDQLGTSHYYCRIYNTDPSGMVNYVHTPSIKIEIVADPNAGTVTKPDVGTDTEANKALADAIGQSVSDALKNQNTQSSQDAMNTGNDVSQDLLDAVPDHSTKFLPYIRDLANSMGYTGTTCVLTMPAITVPAVGTHFNAITVLDEQQINFEDYFNKMPELIMTIVRALFDIAVVFFCLREFNHTIQQVLTGFKDMKDDLEDF